MISCDVGHLYLARLMLNPRSRRVMSELARPYEMHRTLMRAFPDLPTSGHQGARAELSVLFRPEFDELRRSIQVYVQSTAKPDWSPLKRIDGYLLTLADDSSCQCKEIMQVYKTIRKGQVLRFRLRANPTKRVAKDGDPLKGKRVEIQNEEEQIEWLKRKGVGKGGGGCGGFEIVERRVMGALGEFRAIPCVTVRNEGKQKWKKREGDSDVGHTLTHLAVVFEGLLRVTDADSFVHTLIHGVGPGKAFGFGLLSIAPVGNDWQEEGT